MADMITIDWSGKRLSGPQAYVLLRAAQQFPADKRDALLEFEHELCEGIITCKGEKTIGTYAGVIFHAHLGTHNGKPWTYEFMLLGGYEEAPVGTWTTLRDDDSLVVEVVNQKRIKTARTRVARRN